MGLLSRLFGKKIKEEPSYVSSKLNDFQLGFGIFGRTQVIVILIQLAQCDNEWNDAEIKMVSQCMDVLCVNPWDLEHVPTSPFDSDKYDELQYLGQAQKDWLSVAIISLALIDGDINEKEAEKLEYILHHCNISMEQCRAAFEKAQSVARKFSK